MERKNVVTKIIFIKNGGSINGMSESEEALPRKLIIKCAGSIIISDRWRKNAEMLTEKGMVNCARVMNGIEMETTGMTKRLTNGAIKGNVPDIIEYTGNSA